jgi:fatty-acyl-CoA synthase
VSVNPFSSFTTRSDVAAQRPIGGLSHVKGLSTPELSNDTIGDLLDKAVQTWGNREAFVFLAPRLRWTWRQFQVEVDKVAAGLLCLGVEPGDRVGIWSPNRPEWVLVQFATARIGAVLVNINPAYRVSELEYALNKVGVKVLVCAQGMKTTDYLAMLSDIAPELKDSVAGRLKLARLPALQTIVQFSKERHGGTFTFDQLVDMGGAAQMARVAIVGRSLKCHDAINIQFTSGTTGHPKGATLSHHNVVNNARFVAGAMRLDASDRLCVPVPLYHCFGMVLGVLVCASSGSCMVFPGESFDAVSTLAAVSSERCTALHGVPTMFVAMLGVPNFSQFDLSSLRTGVMAGAPCPIETMKRVVSDMHMPQVTIGYGMTETSPISFQSSTDDNLERRVSTVGRVQPHLEVMIVDEAGQSVPVGATGELWTKGYSVMRGYWGDEERTRESIVNGWMRTGDLATIDAYGYCNIVGRLKDMLIRGGENIYPREIEEFLYGHPSIAEVQVFGVPDSKYGEEICAWVVPKSGAHVSEDAIRDYCRGRIAHYKVPRYIRLVEALPMTVTGKAQKFVMRNAMIEQLGLTVARTA